MKTELKIDEYSIPMEVISSSHRKRSISMQVKQQGLIIRVPKHISDSHIKTFVDNKKNRIVKHRMKQLKFAEKTITYQHGSTVPYYGNECQIVVEKIEKKKPTLHFSGTRFLLCLPENLYALQGSDEYFKSIEPIFTSWMRSQAKKVLLLETQTLAKKFNFNPGTITVRFYKTKYGQCKGRDITYDYRIIKFPIGVIRHIILHELCHLEHKHHRQSFWNALELVDEGFSHHVKRLKQNGLSIHC